MRQQGEDDTGRNGRDVAGMLCIGDMAQAAPTTSGVFGGGSTRRWSMALLGEMATAAGVVGFADTNGGQKRRRDKSNPKRCGAGYSPCTAEAAKDCTRFRRMYA